MSSSVPSVTASSDSFNPSYIIAQLSSLIPKDAFIKEMRIVIEIAGSLLSSSQILVSDTFTNPTKLLAMSDRQLFEKSQKGSQKPIDSYPEEEQPAAKLVTDMLKDPLEERSTFFIEFREKLHAHARLVLKDQFLNCRKLIEQAHSKIPPAATLTSKKISVIYKFGSGEVSLEIPV